MKILITVILNTIKLLSNLILLPINALVVSVLPDYSTYINNFNSLVTRYVGGGISYFSSMLPPMTKDIIIFYLSLLIIMYTTVLTLHLTLKIFKIIKVIKFW